MASSTFMRLQANSFNSAIEQSRSSYGVLSQRKQHVVPLQLEAFPSASKSFQTRYGKKALKTVLAIRSAATTDTNVTDAETVAAGKFIPASPVLLPEGPWQRIPGGVTAAKGFQATGMYAGLRAAGKKPDLALVVCDTEAVSAGTFTKNVVAAAPVIFCKEILAESTWARAILINAGQANAATGDAGYQDTLDCAAAVAKHYGVPKEAVLIESTGVIGHRIKKGALIEALPKLVASLSSSVEAADAAAVAITTTDLVSKSVAIETEIGGTTVRLGGIAKGSGMIHPNMATMLGVVTCDADVAVDVWRPMVLTAVNRSFNQITVDGDSSTNDTLLALASGAAGGPRISDINSAEAQQLQAALDAVLQGLAKSIASDGEGATCLVEVTVTGASDEASAATVARSVAASSLVKVCLRVVDHDTVVTYKAAIYGRDPNWGRIACAAGYAGVPFDPQDLQIFLGDFHLMEKGQPLEFDRAGASSYLKATGEVHGTVSIKICIGNGSGHSQAWGCDLSYDYVKINAEYTT